MYYCGNKSDRFECYGVIIVALLVVFKKVAKEPIVHFSIIVAGILFLNYVANLKAVDSVTANEEQPEYFTFQLEGILSEDIFDILKF